jgi:hypothetical protein
MRDVSRRLFATALSVWLITACDVQSSISPDVEPAAAVKPHACCTPLPDEIGDITDADVTDTFYRYSSAPDPNPSADGIWLGPSIQPAGCYKDQTAAGSWGSLIDQDVDGLSDECEYVLAKNFSPLIAASPYDGCFGGEPYWIAKYVNESGFGTGMRVKLGYLPSYYRDCGALGHNGDSEFIQLTVQYNSTTKHWELTDSWLSAHACLDQGISCSTWEGLGSSSTFGRAFSWPKRRYAWPRIWTSEKKHANYRSQSACTGGGGAGTDTCLNNLDFGRFHVYRAHNIGSPLHPFRDCVRSEQPGTVQQLVTVVEHSNTGRSPGALVVPPQYTETECYWTVRDFGGWLPRSSAGIASPYRKYLNSVVWGAVRIDATNWWWGTFSH